MKALISDKGLDFRAMLRDVAKGKHGARDLEREEAARALEFLFSAEADNAQVGAFLTAMRFKSTKLDEFLGFFDTIYNYADTITPAVDNLISANGPYDGRKHTLQLSPANAILTAAAGVPILLHSSDGLPPKDGVTSGKVLEALGIPAYLAPQAVQNNIERHGFGFLHSRVFSHGIERLRPVRETLFYRSFLHACEVLMNPGHAKRTLLGAAHGNFVERFLDVHAAQGVEHVLSVQGLDGGDEVGLKPTLAVEYRNGTKEKFTLAPGDYGLDEREPEPCRPPGATAELIRATLEQRDASVKDAVIYNAGIRIYLGGKAGSIGDGITLARQVLESGQALEKLNELACPPTH